MNFSKETIDKITAEIIDKELGAKSDSIKRAVKQHLEQYLKTKYFKKFVAKQIKETVEELINDDGPFAYLDPKHTSELMKKAVRSILK